MTREQLLAMLFGGQDTMQNPMQQQMGGQMLGQSPPQGFSLLEDGSLQGVLGGMGREGGGLIGQGFASLFGNDGVVDLGGSNQFRAGTGFQQQAQGAYQPNMPPPMAAGLNFGALFNSMFGM